MGNSPLQRRVIVNRVSRCVAPFHTNPKRKRGNDLTTWLALRVSIICSRSQQSSIAPPESLVQPPNRVDLHGSGKTGHFSCFRPLIPTNSEIRIGQQAGIRWQQLRETEAFTLHRVIEL